jgi:pimeloyl-ACP methyl ester carboxylesterase
MAHRLAPLPQRLPAGDHRKPVFVVLHGGPGMPFPGVAYRGRSPLAEEGSRLPEHFVVVCPDQRGSGKSRVTKYQSPWDG